MRKIFTLLCSVAFAAHCTYVSAQQTKMLVHLNSGRVAEFSIDEIDSVTFAVQNQDDHSKVINGHKFIDLGLPSGVLWAETNLGAATAAADGEYYAWGETEPKSDYTWDTYKWTADGGNTFTKYVLDSLATDSVIALEAADDAATAIWGAPCRMPNSEEIDELRDEENCTWTWTSMATADGGQADGYVVASTRNGNSIFIPASGYRVGESLGGHGSYGNFWSGVLTTDYSDYAYYLYFDSGYQDQFYDERYYGHTIRPVAEP